MLITASMKNSESDKGGDKRNKEYRVRKEKNKTT